MSEQKSISKTSEMNPRTARTVAAILTQTSTDEALKKLNQSDGRNQSEQASYLASESPFLRDLYERGGTVTDGLLTVPKENLSLSPEIEITTLHTAVEKLAKLTNDAALARELAPQFIEMGEKIAGSQADGETRVKVFGWLYRTLEGKEELLQAESAEKSKEESINPTKAEFSEKWRQIVELSEALAELEPKDRLPENSLESLSENLPKTAIEPDESSLAAEIYETAIEAENAEHAEEYISGGNLIAFERMEIASDLPKIPDELSPTDFEKLLEKAEMIDSQLERGVPRHEILAPFKRYVELTKFDNELRLVEEEFFRTQGKTLGRETDLSNNNRFVAKQEELRELAEDRATLLSLQKQKAKVGETIQTEFLENIDREKVERSIKSPAEKIELTEDEKELQKLFIQEKRIEREINSLSESISERENTFRPLNEILNEQIPPDRQQELIKQISAMELPFGSLLMEKYPEMTARERHEKLAQSNTYEIRNPAEYLFVREAAKRQFEVLRFREIKNEYRKFENKSVGKESEKGLAQRNLYEHQEKIQTLQKLEPDFAYKLEGSNRILKAKPSERAVAGYKFVSEYIRYQLKQPETRLRRESSVYRDYAARLESAKTSNEVIREAYQIRQENHRAVGVWKNSTAEERQNLPRPLTKSEITQLFLEQSPKHFSGEMSVLKYNFAHYSEAKRRMTVALEEGKLEPSAEAKKLAESLEGRLNRRDVETRHKATKHFFESLKIENEKLYIKNAFCYHSLYQNLPPHEKDWIYRRATEQKVNLEYKIVYEKEVNSEKEKELLPQNQTISEKAVGLRQEFAASTLWHQANILHSQKSKDGFAPVANLDEKTVQAIGLLIHNKSETINLRIADWLEKQKSEKLKTAGEILKTFAQAKREIENNQLTVTVKIKESEQVSINDYQKLFSQFFPADFEKIKDFRLDKNEKFRLENSRRAGQTATLDLWQTEAQNQIYRPDAPHRVFENERLLIEEINKFKQIQIECRRALETKSSILLKYEEKLKKELTANKKVIEPENLRTAVESAFVPEKSKTLSVEQKRIFAKAQNKILLSDFERFSIAAKNLNKGITEINDSFEKIAALRLENSEYAIAPQKQEKGEVSQTKKESTLLPENKPVTLKIYERELVRNERAVMQAKISNMLEHGKLSLNDLETKKAEEIFSAKMRDEIRLEAGERTRENLEPKELWAKRNSVSEKLQNAAVSTSETLERAHEIYRESQNPEEISEIFSKLDNAVIRLKNERRTERQNAKFINFKTDFKRDLAHLFERSHSFDNPQMLTAMTKGLLIDSLEKQSIQPEKYGISREKINEISRTISLAMVDDKKRQKMPVAGKFTVNFSEESQMAQKKNNLEKQNEPVKLRQYEHSR